MTCLNLVFVSHPLRERRIESIRYITLVVLPYVVVPLYLWLILRRLWFWMKLYNPALKLIPGPGSTIRVWARQYRPTIELFPKETPDPLAVRVWRDVKGFLLFSGLFARDKALWLGSWLFHASLAVILVVHLKWLFPLASWVGDDRLAQAARVSGRVLMVSAVYLLVRRLLVTRVRQITSFSDYFAEVVFALTVATGLWVGADPPDASMVSGYLAGLFALSPSAPPFGLNLVLHLLLFEVLLVAMPFSHLLHSGGIFMSRRFLASPDTFSGDVEGVRRR